MLKLIYNQKITILNKLKQADSLTNRDIWHKTVVDNAAWYPRVERTVSGGSVYIGTYVRVLIPFNEKYLDYRDWKQAGNQDSHYTMSSGDYIVLGEVTEDITADNVVKVMKTYEPDVCLVKHCQPLHDRFGAYVQLSVEGT